MLISWSVNLDGQQYAIELEHGFFSGNRVVTVNGEVMHKSRKFFDSGTSEHHFLIGTHSGKITIRSLFDMNYALYVDGTLREKQKISSLQLMKTMPIWGWLLVLAMAFWMIIFVHGLSGVTGTILSFESILIFILYGAFFVVVWGVSGAQKFPLWQRLPLSLLLVCTYFVLVIIVGCSCQFSR